MERDTLSGDDRRQSLGRRRNIHDLVARVHGRAHAVVYTNIGHSVFSDDGGHFYAGGGFKVLIGR